MRILSATYSYLKVLTGLVFVILLFALNGIVYAQSISVFDIDQSSFPTIKTKFMAFDKEPGLINNQNDKHYYVEDSHNDKIQNENTLRVVSPNGSETFVIGSDNVITWEGVLPGDTVRLEYSIDNGKTWTLITDQATGLSYKWKNIPNSESNQCLVRASLFNNTDKTPCIQWQKCLGGSAKDLAKAVIESSDGNYVIAGITLSSDGDVLNNNYKLSHNFWVVKLNPAGQILWQKCLGGTDYDFAYSLTESSDSGYVIAGVTYSIDGDVKVNHGGYDAWIVKLDKSGQLIWQKCLGGHGLEEALSIKTTKDGGYIVAGYTTSEDGDVNGLKGYRDAWIIKLNFWGEIQWQKCIGGTGEVYACSVTETFDGGYAIVGGARSHDGDTTCYRGASNYWIAKLDKSGQLVWQKCLGGDEEDWGWSIIQSADGSYIVTGSTDSYDGDVKGKLGLNDAWSLKLDELGQIIWQKCLGGSFDDYSYSISETSTGEYLIAGTVYWDVLIAKIDRSGEMLWQKRLRGSNTDHAYSGIQTRDGGYLIAGITCSNDGDVIGNHGDSDMWLIKFSPDGFYQTDLSDSVFSIKSSLDNSETQEFIKKIYPNPTENEIIIDYNLPEKSYTHLYITNILGERVKDIVSDNSPSTGLQTIKADISGLGSGSYLIILETMNGCQSKRMEIVK